MAMYKQFLNMTAKTQSMKEIINKLDIIQIKNVCSYENERSY